MQVMELTGPRVLVPGQRPQPVISADDEVLVRMTTVGVCGSDVHYYSAGRIGSQVVDFPFIVGHEGAGQVVATGTAVEHVSPGDAVAIEPAMCCGHCDQCRIGRMNTCRNLRFLGCPGQAEGCLAEYLVMPASSCIPLPSGVDAEQAALSEPLAISLYALRRAALSPQTTVGIFGYGPIGMGVHLMMTAHGCCAPWISEPLAERRRLAQGQGAAGVHPPEQIEAAVPAAVPELLDVAFECCGEQEALDQALRLLKPGGTLMLIGIPPTLDNWSMPVDLMRHREITVRNVRRQCGCVEDTLHLIAAGRIDTEAMISHRLPFAATAQAFDMVADYRDGVMKAMVEVSNGT